MQRFIVERISDGRLLDLEFPIEVSSASTVLSGYGRFSGTVEPDDGGLRDESGSLIIDPYGSFIHEEIDGVIRGTWLVTRSELEGESWKIEGAGFSSFFSGRPFEGEYWGVQVDPLDAARNVVNHAQSFANADIGVTLVGSSTVRVGTDSDIQAAAAKKHMDTRKKVWDEAAKPRKRLEAQVREINKQYARPLQLLNRERQALADTYADEVARHNKLLKRKPKPTTAEINASKALVTAAKTPLDAKRTQIANKKAERTAEIGNRKTRIEDMKFEEEPLKASYDAAKAAYDEAKQKAQDDEGAWKQLWWDTPDCFDLITEAIDAAGYEWVEWSGWNKARTKILKEIRCSKTVGVKQTALRFMEGENVTETVIVEDDSGEYANAVTAIGAGEGKAALRVRVAKSDGRRRKVHVLDAKHVTKKATLEKLASKELTKRLQRLVITDIRVDGTHPNALRGTFGVGDRILVDAEVGWIGRQRLWRRIEEIEWDGDLADLVLGDA